MSVTRCTSRQNSLRSALLTGTVFALGWLSCSAASAQTATAAPDNKVVPSASTDQNPPAASPAAAQQTGDIIVTAQRRAERVQDVPVSITVVTADQLARRGTQSVQDLSQTSASLEFTSPTASPGGGGFVRGIGTQSLGSNTASASVSLVLDGVVLGNAPILDLFDVNRVEVLKGPQGTLFGSSVSAGVLNVVTNSPVIGQTSGFIDGELGFKAFGSDYSRFVVRGGVNLPVSDTSALRIAAFADGNDDLYKNTFNNTGSTEKSYGARVRYLWNITPNLTFNLIGDYNRLRQTNEPTLFYRYAAPGSVLSQALTTCGITPSPSNTQQCGDLPHLRDVQVGGVSGQFDLALGSVTLTSITSYRKYDESDVNDPISISTGAMRATFGTQCFFANCTPIISLGTTTGRRADTNRNLITQELRLTSGQGNRFEWVTGLYYQHDDANITLPITIRIHPPMSPVDITAATLDYLFKTSGDNYAVFGNGTFHLTSSTRIIAGARYTHSTVDETAIDRIANQSYSLGVSANALTYRAGIQQDFSRNTMAYATVSSGFKAPQINDQFINMLSGVRAERPTSFEVGVKQSLLNRRLFVNADLFYTHVRDFQTQSCIPDPNRGLACANINVDGVNTRGAELEIFGRLLRGLTANLSAIYNVVKYPNGVRGADGTDLSGQQLNFAPKFKVTASLEQEVPLTERFNFVVGSDVTYRTKQSEYLSNLPIYVVPAAALVNARVGIRSRDNWGIYVFGRNLSDKTYPNQLYTTAGYAAGGVVQAIDASAERIVGLQFQAKF